MDNSAPSSPAILCIGTSGSGKSTLLRNLQMRDDPSTAKETIPTMGTNLSVITRNKRDKEKPNERNMPKDDTVVIREIGGTMVQLWPSFIEPVNTRGILYVVDASEPESLGRATIHLLEFLNRPELAESTEILIVFSKTDIKSSRSLTEIKFIMRLNHIIVSSKRQIYSLHFNAETQENQDKILEWCLKFSTFC